MTIFLGIFACSGASIALAQTEYPIEGGRWDYGYHAAALTINSDYYHEYRCHGSTVKSGDRENRSREIQPGHVAHAGLGWVGWLNPKEYYYNVC